MPDGQSKRKRRSTDVTSNLRNLGAHWYYIRYVPRDVAHRIPPESLRAPRHGAKSQTATVDSDGAASLPATAATSGAPSANDAKAKRVQPRWKVSLKTTDIAEARREAKEWDRKTDAAIALARAEIKRESLEAEKARLQAEREKWAKLELTPEQIDLLDSTGGLPELVKDLRAMRRAERFASEAELNHPLIPVGQTSH